MLLYTLNPVTLKFDNVIEAFETCLWVERFLDPGETKIVMPANHANAVLTRPGTLLLHEDSDEPMLIETRDIKEGAITAQGYTIEKFFNDRVVSDWARGGLPANMMRDVVTAMQTRFDGRYAIANLRAQDMEDEGSWADGFPVEDSGNVMQPNQPPTYAPVHDLLTKLGQKYGLGMYVKRLAKSDGSMELVFGVRYSNDRTYRPSSTYLSLSPNNDTFNNPDELYSLADWVDVILVHPPIWTAVNTDGNGNQTPGFTAGWPPIPYPNDAAQGGPSNFTLTAENPFNWRIREIDSEDITEDYINRRVSGYYAQQYGYPYWTDMTDEQKTDVLIQEMQLKGSREYANNQNKRKIAFDGEIPENALKYGTDYHLGDIVDTEGNFTGGKQQAMISEYVRVSDQQGPRGYPSLAQVPGIYEPAQTAQVMSS